MRQGAGGRRPRGRSGGGRKNVPLKNQNFDSNGPDVRVRGNAHQVYEKYLALARDATSAGDRVIAESYFQHAEHYYRIFNENTDPSTERDRNRDMERDGDRENGHASGPDDGGRGTRQERRENYEREERTQGDDGGRGNGHDGRQPAARDAQSETRNTAEAAERADAQPNDGRGDGARSGGTTEQADTPTKPRRGRPRRTRRPDGFGRLDGSEGQEDGQVPSPAASAGETDAAPAPAPAATDGAEPAAGDAPKPKRGRGRPRKVKASEDKGDNGQTAQGAEDGDKGTPGNGASGGDGQPSF